MTKLNSKRLLSGQRENCKEGEDPNSEEDCRSREQKDGDWETCVKMALIARDIMTGNPKLEKAGFGEEALRS